MWKTLVSKCIRHFGYDIGQWRPGKSGQRPEAPGVNEFVDQKIIFGDKQPVCVFDLGAHHGNTVAFYRNAFTHATIHAFEPHPESFEQLSSRFETDGKVRCVKAAVSDHSGTASFFNNLREYTNSLLPVDERSRNWVHEEATRSVSKEQVVTITLDAYCEANGVRKIDLLKSDIQGAELRALRGATSLLGAGAIDVLMLEVLFAPLYEGQANFCDLVSELGKYDYNLLGIYNINRGANGLAGWADAIWVRKDFQVPDEFKVLHGV